MRLGRVLDPAVSTATPSTEAEEATEISAMPRVARRWQARRQVSVLPQRRAKLDPRRRVIGTPLWAGSVLVGRGGTRPRSRWRGGSYCLLEGDDLGVVDEAVDHGCGDDVVAEDLAPPSERLVACDDQAGALVAGGDELKNRFAASGFERAVADLVVAEQRVSPEPGELGLQSARVMAVGEAGAHGEAVAEKTRSPACQARIASQCGEVGLPGSGGPSSSTLSLAVTTSRGPRCSTRSRFRPRAWSKSNSSKALARGTSPRGSGPRRRATPKQDPALGRAVRHASVRSHPRRFARTVWRIGPSSLASRVHDVLNQAALVARDRTVIARELQSTRDLEVTYRSVGNGRPARPGGATSPNSGREVRPVERDRRSGTRRN